MEPTLRSRTQSWLLSPVGVAMAVVLLAAAYYLGKYHLEHVIGLLPFGFLLLCPFMHLFMHGGHGSHDGHAGHGDTGDTRPSSDLDRQSEGCERQR